ncbi:hypothetical protein D1872_36600 [compost metagenome]
MLLYEKNNYLNRNIQYLISNEIIEYDIQSAGFNLIKKYKLISDSKIQYLESLSKKERQVRIGIYMTRDRKLFKHLNEKFVEARKWFFEQNQIRDEDVLSIKRDAIITLRRCNILEWDNVIFAEKNIYTSYYYLNRFEFYYHREGIDVKGINDDMLESHREYMLDFIHTFAKLQEMSTPKRVIELIMDFSKYYRERRLNIGYYRELNVDSLFRYPTKYNKQIVGSQYYDNVNNIEIGYNYAHYLIPLISLLI